MADARYGVGRQSMSKRDIEAEARLQGLDMAYRIACREEGENSPTAKAILKEIRFRRKSGVVVPIIKKELAKASTDIKNFTIQTIFAMSMLILWETFGWGKVRLTRFKQAFDEYSDLLINDDIDWLDVMDALKVGAKVEVVLPTELTEKGGDNYA